LVRVQLGTAYTLPQQPKRRVNALVILRWFLLVIVLTGCAPAAAPGQRAASPSTPVSSAPPAESATQVSTLRKERAELGTRIVRTRKKPGHPPPVPPASTKLERVKYRSPLGDMWAYVTIDPKDGEKHPAVVWAAGGFANRIGEGFFKPGPAKNDQSASQLRAAGIIVMYPSYRGNHDNPGTFELFFGEVDDYLAAADHLRQLSYVDPARIYFAGHSTGGTLALLAAELTDQFRAAFVFGPVTGAESYGKSLAPFDLTTPETAQEWRLRAPIRYVRDIRRPTFLIEGERSPNARALPIYARAATATGVPLTTLRPDGLDHFSVLAPQLELIARKIVADDGQGEFAW